MVLLVRSRTFPHETPKRWEMVWNVANFNCKCDYFVINMSEMSSKAIAGGYLQYLTRMMLRRELISLRRSLLRLSSCLNTCSASRKGFNFALMPHHDSRTHWQLHMFSKTRLNLNNIDILKLS